MMLFSACLSISTDAEKDTGLDVFLAQSSLSQVTPFLTDIWLNETALDIEHDCTDAGTFIITGARSEDPVGSFTGTLNISFDNCNLIDGEISLSGNSQLDLATYSSNISGSLLVSGCTLFFDSLTYDFAAEQIDTMTGTLTSFCAQSPSLSVLSCVWNEDGSDDAGMDAFLENCACATEC